VTCGAESFLAGTGACRVRVAGLDELRTELEGRGAVAADAAIVDQWWGDRELHVTDADGNLITFFQAAARQ
jgi:hypothetical protein